MKRKITALLLACVMLLPTFVFAAEVEISTAGSYTVNGSTVISQGPLPFMDQDVLYVPVVATLSSLGINAGQSGSTVTTDNTAIQAGSGTFTKNGAQLVSKTAPVLVNDVVYADASFMKIVYDVTVTEAGEDGIVKASYYENKSSKVTISPDGKYTGNSGETYGPAPVVEDKILFLPVVSVLSSVEIGVEQSGSTVISGNVKITASNNQVYVGSTCYVAKHAPKYINGVVYGESEMMKALYGVKIDLASDGTVTVTYGEAGAGGGDEGLQTDDSWYYEMVDQSDPYVGLSDVEIIKKNITRSVSDPTGDPTSIMSKMRPDGSFSDIEYFNYESGFPPGGHIDRIATLSKICYTPENKWYKDPELINAIVKTTDYWLKHKFRSTGWWYNVVSTPQSWQNVLVTQPDCLDKYMDEIKTYCKGVEWGGNGDSSRPFVLHEENNTENLTRPYTGSGPGPAERIFVSMKEMFWLDDRTEEENDQKMREAMEGLSIELGFISTRRFYNKTDYEGETLSIQADGTYHDHANAFMQLSYGFHFLTATASTLEKFKGTSYRLSDEAVIGAQNMLLDGYRWVFYQGNGKSNDSHRIMNAMGRGSGAGSYAEANYYVSEPHKAYLTSLADYLLKEYTDVLTRPDELQDFVNWLANPVTDNFEGNRYFWVSDYLSHHRKDWNFSILIPSQRMKVQETLDDQGQNQLFFAAGYYNLLTNGEDTAYPAARDYNRLPGTTVQMNYYTLSPGAARPAELGAEHFEGNDIDSKLVGGTSDGMYGMGMFEFHGMINQPELRRSMFCFDNEVVCLGADINGKGKDGVISTTVDQALTKGAVKYGTASESNDISNEGDAVRTEIAGATWVLNGDTGYVLTGNEKASYVETGNRTGNISKCTGSATGYEDTTRNITIVGIDHDYQPVGESYAYTILPHTTEEEIMAYSADPKAQIAANTKDVQAVWHKDLNILQAAFFKPGSVTTPDGSLTLTVSNACAVMVRMYDDGSYSIHAADPEQRTIRTQVALSGAINNTVAFQFTEHEKGWYAGKTMHWYSKEGTFRDIATYNPNEGENTEITEAAELLAVNINGELYGSFNRNKHYYYIGTFDEVPEIKAKGNFETRVVHQDDSAVIRVTDPSNPANEAIYTLSYYIREPKTEE